MSSTDYRHSDVADGIAATLAAGDNAFTDVGKRAYGSNCTVFAVTTDTGQQFTVTVDPVDAEPLLSIPRRPGAERPAGHDKTSSEERTGHRWTAPTVSVRTP